MSTRFLWSAGVYFSLKVILFSFLCLFHLFAPLNDIFIHSVMFSRFNTFWISSLSFVFVHFFFFRFQTFRITYWFHFPVQRYHPISACDSIEMTHTQERTGKTYHWVCRVLASNTLVTIPTEKKKTSQVATQKKNQRKKTHGSSRYV